MNLISTAISSANTASSFNPGMVVELLVAAVVFVVIVRAIVKSGKTPGESRDEKFYLREIRKYVRIIAFILLGCLYFTAVWFIISAL